MVDRQHHTIAAARDQRAAGQNGQGLRDRIGLSNPNKPQQGPGGWRGGIDQVTSPRRPGTPRWHGGQPKSAHRRAWQNRSHTAAW
jgi:hypothetical protein